jgi:transcriptional regulator with XRE-family HTH domain
VDSAELAAFLRTRRKALQPEDVSLPRGARRRTAGLRREEVAQLVGMSTDYYSRIERGVSPKLSAQMTAAIARGLRLSIADRDHLFVLVGHKSPTGSVANDHVSPGLMRILDRIDDTPAQVMGEAGETLIQTRMGRALYGDQTLFTGLSRAVAYRWFTDRSARNIYVAEDHETHGRHFTSQLRSAVAKGGAQSFAATVARELSKQSEEFASLWAAHEVGVKSVEPKRIVHPEVGLLELFCQVLLDPEHGHVLLVFTANPGSLSSDRLRVLASRSQS